MILCCNNPSIDYRSRGHLPAFTGTDISGLVSTYKVSEHRARSEVVILLHALPCYADNSWCPESALTTPPPHVCASTQTPTHTHTYTNTHHI